MEKVKLIEAIKAQGLYSEFKKHELWVQAFSLYAESNPRICQCSRENYIRVRKWLEN
jgi:hypothetical protein